MGDKKETAPESNLERALLKFLEAGERNAMTPEMLTAILEKVGVQSAHVMHKAVRPENEIHPHISAFSYPEGDIARPKPTLKRKTFLVGHEEKEEQLTPAEILAYNSIDEDYETRGGDLKAIITQRGRKREELYITLPVKGINDRMNAPASLLLLVHELKTGKSLEDMNDLLAEIAALRAEVSNYRANHPVASAAVKSSSIDTGLDMPRPSKPGVAGLEEALEAAAVSR